MISLKNRKGNPSQVCKREISLGNIRRTNPSEELPGGSKYVNELVYLEVKTD